MPAGDPPTGAPAPDPLPIRDVQFLGGQASPGGWRPANELPEIAMSGRSNVGKSSLINRLLRRRAIARVSQTPGKTREINFYRVNDTFCLVDLPGYGFARVSKEMRGEWRTLIEGYLRRSPHLRGIVQLVDARHAPSADDRQMLDALAHLGAPAIIVATKVDKLRRAEAAARPAEIARELGVDVEQVIPFSAITGEGRDELAAAMVALLEAPAWERR